ERMENAGLVGRRAYHQGQRGIPLGGLSHELVSLKGKNHRLSRAGVNRGSRPSRIASSMHLLQGGRRVLKLSRSERGWIVSMLLILLP
ncbi:MAG TPA: hypothetical protein VNA27_05300, partial [Rubrobacteraceae bacterium]|nr:hypothetical protein [Rubrobacteraceae bacterium]